jgi:hypothetical protein
MTLVQNEMSEDAITPADGTPGHLEYATPLMRASGWWGQGNASRMEVRERTTGFEVHHVDYAREEHKAAMASRRPWKEWRRTCEPVIYPRKQDAVAHAQAHYREWQNCVAEDPSDQWDRHRADLAYERRQPSIEVSDRIHRAEERESIDAMRRGLLKPEPPDDRSGRAIQPELYR